MGVGAIWRLAIIGVGGLGQELVCTHHYRQLNDDVGSNGGEDLCVGWAGEATDAFAATFAESNGITRLEARGITDPTEGFDFSYPDLVAGTRVSAQVLPPQSSCVLTWTTGLIGRRYRGRNYMWYTIEDDQNQGTFSAEYRALVDNYASVARFITATPDNSAFDMVVYSKPNPDLDPPWGGAITPVTSWIIRNLVYTQRRRVVGVGS